MNQAKPFDSYELSLCFQYTDGIGMTFWERYEGDDIASDSDLLVAAQHNGATSYTWTLYGHKDGEGATAFYDAQTLAEAAALYESITGLPSEIDPDTTACTVFFLPARTA